MDYTLHGIRQIYQELEMTMLLLPPLKGQMELKMLQELMVWDLKEVEW